VTTPDSPPDRPADTNPEADRVVADIEATRAELGETVDALAGKLDVKAQARDRVDETRKQVTRALANAREAATDDRGNPTTAAKGAAGAAAAVVVGLVVASAVRRRRRG
jgi:hypothetical protein